MSTDLLKKLATDFGSNSISSAKAIREMSVLDPVGFPSAVLEVLRQEPELPGSQFLVAILASNANWLPTVCDPEKHTLQQSLDLVRRAHKFDPLTEMKLAEILAPRGLSTDAEARFASRVFAVLKSSPPSAALPALRQLSRCPNAHMRSKAALLIGRINQNPQWATRAKSELDPRFAANAVESLWGLATRPARDAFFSAAMNEHHRIAANGIVGLYLMGDESGVSLLFQMSRSETALARSAAAWAMGHLEDPRFLPALGGLMKDSDPMTRTGAVRSTGRIRQRMSQLRAVGDLRVQIQDCECRAEDHVVRFTVTKGECHVDGLDQRQFVVWNGPDLVEEFSFSLPEGKPTFYEIAYEGPPSDTHLVKVQVYADAGVGEESGFETALN